MISRFYLTDYWPGQTEAFSNITLATDIHLAIARDSYSLKIFNDTCITVGLHLSSIPDPDKA